MTWDVIGYGMPENGRHDWIVSFDTKKEAEEYKEENYKEASDVWIEEAETSVWEANGFANAEDYYQWRGA